MAARRNVSATERRLAQSLLRRLGVPVNDVDAIAAIVAWMRASSGGRIGKARGFNIFRIRIGTPGLGGLAIGSYTEGGQRYAKFANYADAVRAMARILLAGRLFGVQAIVRALRRGQPLSSEARGVRINDILTAITLSNIDMRHFNMRQSSAGGLTSDLWVYFAGVGTVTLPPPPTPAPPKRRPFPTRPRDLLPPPKTRVYIDGFRVRGFYLATRPKYPDGLS